MRLCETCKKSKCNKTIVIIENKKDKLTITKCLDYEKDENKIKIYKKLVEKVNKS